MQLSIMARLLIIQQKTVDISVLSQRSLAAMPHLTRKWLLRDTSAQHTQGDDSLVLLQRFTAVQHRLQLFQGYRDILR
jgi:hypothetical protein